MSDYFDDKDTSTPRHEPARQPDPAPRADLPRGQRQPARPRATHAPTATRNYANASRRGGGGGRGRSGGGGRGQGAGAAR